MNKGTRCIIRKFIIDLLCLGIVGVPLLMFKSISEPFKRGFFCSDESLGHPYHGSTVPFLAVKLIGFGATSIIILCTEYWRTTKRIMREERLQPLIFAGRTIPTWICESYKVIGLLCFGGICTKLTTDIGKDVLGRLRPHFMDMCKPNINCTLAENLHRYIEEYECLGTNMRRVVSSRRSFPSGHASLSFYTMIFFALYIQFRWTWRGSKLARHLVQFLAFSMAWYTALSRVSDYKHHWSDVLAGSILGTMIAILIVLHAADLYHGRRSRQEQNNSVLPILQQEKITTLEIVEA